jgi:hypothetical protein
VDRTLRAALLAALLTGGSIAFFGIFLGFDPGGTLVAAAVVAALAALLIWGAARRAETFTEPTPPTPGTGPTPPTSGTGPTPPAPGSPGPPDHDDGSPADPRDD